MCRDAGLTAEKLFALPDFEESGLFSERERLVLRYARAMTQTPVQVSEELFAALATCFHSRQLVELTASIAWENFRARFDHAFAMESEGFFEGASCVLPPAHAAEASAAETVGASTDTG